MLQESAKQDQKIRYILNDIEEVKQIEDYKIMEQYYSPPTIEQIQLIDQDEKFDIASILNQREIGIDIEFNKQLGYFGTICLIQFAYNGQSVILDTLKINSDVLKKNLKAIFENEKIMKIFYGGTQDILWLKQCYGIQVAKPVFDVKVAAEQLQKNNDNSLTSLWKSYCQLDFDKEEKKKLQLSDWTMRPLSIEQISYSALDAFYLPFLRQLLINKIIEKGGSEAIIKLYNSLEKKLILDVDDQMNTLNLSQALKFCQKQFPDIVKQQQTHQYLLQEKYLHFMIFIYLELWKTRNIYSYEQKVNSIYQVERDEDLVDYIVNQLKQQDKIEMINQGEFQKYLSNEDIKIEYLKYFESEIKNPIQILMVNGIKWNHIKKFALEKILKFILLNLENINFAINFSSNEANSIKKTSEMMELKKEVNYTI